MALDSILGKSVPTTPTATPRFSHPTSGYGRKDVDDMVINNFIARNGFQQQQQYQPQAYNPNSYPAPQGQTFQYPQPAGMPSYPVPVKTTAG